MSSRIHIALVGALLAAGPALAQEWGRVLSSTPVISQVSVPQTVCPQAAPMQGRTSGAGALMGAIAGGAVGQSIGQGSGRAAATAIGIVGGAMIGDRIESPGPAPRHCHMVQAIEQRVTGYDVRYEYAGRTYIARMPSDPGPWVALQIAPVGSLPPAPPPVGVYQTMPEPASVATQTVIESRTVFVAVAPAWGYHHHHARTAPPVIVPWYGGAPMRRPHDAPWR